MARAPSRHAKATFSNQEKFPTVAFVNLANTPLGVDLEQLVAVLSKQVEQHFVPVWGYPAELYATDKPKSTDWQVIFLDDADAANALGYHDLTKDGQPISKVFVKTTIAAGQKVSTTASHELMEMMIDPGAQLWAQNTDGRFYAYEMCDAVEDEEYLIDGIAVSDFVYPSFFESWHVPRSVQFDYLQKISQPFQTLQNGYQIVSDGQSMREIFGSLAKHRDFTTLEVRALHRSEYRKAMMQNRSSQAPSTSASSESAHAAVLYHAGQLLTAMAAASSSSQVNPFVYPWELGRRGGQVSPFPNPWQLGRATGMVNPFPWPWQTDPPNGQGF
jgi:hypothetical protein